MACLGLHKNAEIFLRYIAKVPNRSDTKLIMDFFMFISKKKYAGYTNHKGCTHLLNKLLLHLQWCFIIYLCASLQVWAVVKNRKPTSFLEPLSGSWQTFLQSLSTWISASSPLLSTDILLVKHIILLPSFIRWLGVFRNSNALYLNMQHNPKNVNRSRTAQLNNPGQTHTLKNLIGCIFWLGGLCFVNMSWSASSSWFHRIN